jgi:hypothetical protein
VLSETKANVDGRWNHSTNDTEKGGEQMPQPGAKTLRMLQVETE